MFDREWKLLCLTAGPLLSRQNRMQHNRHVQTRHVVSFQLKMLLKMMTFKATVAQLGFVLLRSGSAAFRLLMELGLKQQLPHWLAAPPRSVEYQPNVRAPSASCTRTRCLTWQWWVLVGVVFRM